MAATGAYDVNSSGRSRRRVSAEQVTCSLVDGVVGVGAGEHGGAVVEVDRAPVVGVDEGGLPQLAALVDVRDAGHGEREQLERERVAAPGLVDVDGTARSGPRCTSAESKTASTAACTAASYASSGSVHVVRSPASRIAFSA